MLRRLHYRPRVARRQQNRPLLLNRHFRQRASGRCGPPCHRRRPGKRAEPRSRSALLEPAPWRENVDLPR